MTAEEFRNTIKNESYIGGGSPLHLEFHAFSQRAMKLTCEMNYNYHTPEELRSLMSELTQSFSLLHKIHILIYIFFKSLF